MFAPQPLVFRYGDNGLLGAAAAQAGFGQGYQSAPQHNIVSVSNPRLLSQINGDDTFAEGDANKLQMAHQQIVDAQPQGSSASGNYFKMSSPMTQTISNAKSLARTTQVDDSALSDDQKSQLDSLQNDQNVGVDDFNRVIAGVSGGLQKKSFRDQVAQDAKSKQAVVQSSLHQVAPEDVESLNQYASDPRISANDLRIAVRQSIDKQSVAADAKVQQSTKNALVGQAKGFVHPDDEQAIQQLAADPKVSSQQLHQAMVMSHQRGVQEQARQQAQGLQKLRVQSATLRSDISQLQKAGETSGLSLVRGDEDANNYGPEVAKQYQVLKQKRQQLADTEAQLQSSGGSHPEGTILHSPSTGKMYKVVNGQYVEITNGQ